MLHIPYIYHTVSLSVVSMLVLLWLWLLLLLLLVVITIIVIIIIIMSIGADPGRPIWPLNFRKTLECHPSGKVFVCKTNNNVFFLSELTVGEDMVNSPCCLSPPQNLPWCLKLSVNQKDSQRNVRTCAYDWYWGLTIV